MTLRQLQLTLLALMMALLEINSQSRVVGNGTAGTAMAVPLFATKKEVAPAELNMSLSKLLRETIFTPVQSDTRNISFSVMPRNIWVRLGSYALCGMSMGFRMRIYVPQLVYWTTRHRIQQQLAIESTIRITRLE